MKDEQNKSQKELSEDQLDNVAGGARTRKSIDVDRPFSGTIADNNQSEAAPDPVDIAPEKGPDDHFNSNVSPL